MNEKPLRDHALLDAAHPGALEPAELEPLRPGGFDGGARGEAPTYRRPPVDWPSEDLGPAWRESEFDIAEFFGG
jgi:hypothetical protein